MMTCLDDDALLAVGFADAPPAHVRHAAACMRCAGRLRQLDADLTRIDAHLATAPPPPRPARAVLLLPLAAAAATFVLTLAVLHHGPASPTGDAQVVAFLDAVDDAVAETDPADTAAATSSATDVVFRSTCGLDEPFIGVGCDDMQLADADR
jgi:hypothetical protein